MTQTAIHEEGLVLKFQKLSDQAVAPTKASVGAAGFDLVAISRSFVPECESVIYGTGIALEIPKGYVGLLFPRSSIYKTRHALANSVGVIDSDYRGEVKAVFRSGKCGSEYNIGDRVCQLVLVPAPGFALEEVQELSETARGTGGFGSTDHKKQ